MKMYKIWALVMAVGMMSAHAYEKKCYMRPQYGCKGEIQCLTSKYFVCKSYKPVNHVIESVDGRRVCHIRLDNSDKTRAEAFLSKCDPEMKIADESIELLLKKKGSTYKAVGLILHDFKCNYKDKTVQQAREALNKKDESLAQAGCAQCQ